MSDFLTRMSRESRRRVARARSAVPESVLARRVLTVPPSVPLDARGPGFDLIAEIKRRAPSVGSLSDHESRAEDFARRHARTYVDAGAAAISVLTEPSAFGGSLSDLSLAARSVSVPVMRKDFLVDPYQVLEARACGASGVLLILRLLDDDLLEELIETARSLDMFVLIEAFDRDELQRADEQLRRVRGVSALLGLNCRDLVTLESDRARFRSERRRMSTRVPTVAESGLQSPEDAREVAALGYRLALVGSALTRAADPAALIRAMLAAGREEVTTCESR